MKNQVTPCKIKSMTLRLVAQYLNQLHHCVPQSEYQQKTDGVMLRMDFKNLSNFVAISGVNWNFAVPCLYHMVSVTSEFSSIILCDHSMCL